MFVDASALAAMLLDETKARLLAGRLQTSANRLTAPHCMLEAVAALSASTGLPLPDVCALVERFLAATGIRSLSLPAALGAPAAEAMERFDLSPAQALTYAAARYYRVALLFDDPVFARTDIRPG